MNILLEPLTHHCEPIQLADGKTLIGRGARTFRNLTPDLTARISRRHAEIEVENELIFIKDLSSKNGTTVNGEPIRNHAISLVSGDILTFANLVIYKIRTEKNNETQFLTSPNQFLQAFLNDSIDTKNDENTKSKTTLLKKIKYYFGGRKLHARHQNEFNIEDARLMKWIFTVSIIIAIGCLFVTIDKPSTDAELENLVKKRHYVDALVFGRQALSDGYTSQTVLNLTEKSYIHVLVSRWLEKFNSDQFQSATSVINAFPPIPHLTQSLSINNLLMKITDLQRFYVRANKPIIGLTLRLNKDEKIVKKLLSEWTPNAKHDRELLQKISYMVPNFENVPRNILSKLRTLQALSELYLPAIARLRSQVSLAITSSPKLNIETIIEEFEVKYPKLLGIDILMANLAHYKALRLATEQENLDKLIQLSVLPLPETSILKLEIKKMLNEILPDETTIEKIELSKKLWLKGDAKQAIEILENIQINDKWHSYIKESIANYKNISKQLTFFNQVSNFDLELSKQFINFYNQLNPVRDTYILQRLQTRLKAQRLNILSAANKEYQGAINAWKKYVRTGGLQGKHRLNSTVSDIFKSRTKILTNAYLKSLFAKKYFSLSNHNLNKERLSSLSLISQEIKHQKRWLNALSKLLPTPVLAKKLQLLNVSEDQDHV